MADPIDVRFRTGESVSVRASDPIGHVRAPYYIRGKRGVIERLCGIYGNPEELAYARINSPKQPLYRVRFLQRDIWPGYRGNAEDTLDVEIYQHWLDRA